MTISLQGWTLTIVSFKTHPKVPHEVNQCFPAVSMVKNLPANAGDMDLIPGSGRSHGGAHGNPP